MFFATALVAGLAGLVAAQVETGQATFFEPGLGACGFTNGPNDFIVAVSSGIFDSGVCGRTLTANYQGRSVTVEIVDRCVGCAFGDLDLSPAAFSQLADLSAGRISGVTWQLN